MIPNLNLSEARRSSLEPDGYVMKVVNVGIDPKYNRLQVFLDIAEGPEAGYYERLNDKFSFWGMTLNLKMENKYAWRFARFIDAVRNSNDSFEWNDDGENDERKLLGMYVGIITREEEYLGNDGTVKCALKPYSTVPVQDIRDHNYKVPEKKPLQNVPSAPANGVIDTTVDVEANFGPISDEDMPF